MTETYAHLARCIYEIQKLHFFAPKEYGYDEETNSGWIKVFHESDLVLTIKMQDYEVSVEVCEENREKVEAMKKKRRKFKNEYNKILDRLPS